MGCRYYSQDTGPFRRKPESIDPPNRSADPQVPPPARNEAYQSSFSGATVYGFVNKQFVGCKYLLLDHSPRFVINRHTDGNNSGFFIKQKKLDVSAGPVIWLRP
jgi:hypothetical protein